MIFSTGRPPFRVEIADGCDLRPGVDSAWRVNPTPRTEADDTHSFDVFIHLSEPVSPGPLLRRIRQELPL